MLAAKAAHCPDSPERASSPGAAVEAREITQGRQPAGQDRAHTQAGKGFSDLGAGGRDSTETADHGTQASQLRWEVGERVGKRKMESWGWGNSGAGKHNGKKRPELKPQSHLKLSLPNFHFFCIITLQGRPLLVPLVLKCKNIPTGSGLFA